MPVFGMDPNDPPYQPNGGGGKRKAPPKPKPFAWVPDAADKLNVLLNYVEYRAESNAPAIESAAQARSQLLRNDLPYRSRLVRAAMCVGRSGQNFPQFERCVRNGMRWEGDHMPGPFYTYLGAGAHTPTVAEHGAWVAPLTEVAQATAVLAGTPIPPRPRCPDDPGPPPAKPEGNRFPVKHPFTQEQLNDFAQRNPNIALKELFFHLYNVPKQPVEEGMHSAMFTCCSLIAPLEVKQKMLEWTKRIAADVRWQGHAVDFQVASDADSTRAVCILAFRHKIKVMAPLDSGPVPPKEVTQEQANEYHSLKNRHDEDVQAYKYAQRQIKIYDKKYGALARTVVPPAPDESEVCVTAQTTWVERDAALRKQAVDLSDDNDDDGDQRSAKQARVEPAPAPAPAVAQTGGMDIDKLAEALGHVRPMVKTESLTRCSTS